MMPSQQAVELTGLPGAMDALRENEARNIAMRSPLSFSAIRPQPPGKHFAPSRSVFSSAPWKTGPTETGKLTACRNRFPTIPQPRRG